jgi:hypothetical protein
LHFRYTLGAEERLTPGLSCKISVEERTWAARSAGGDVPGLQDQRGEGTQAGLVVVAADPVLVGVLDGTGRLVVPVTVLVDQVGGQQQVAVAEHLDW